MKKLLITLVPLLILLSANTSATAAAAVKPLEVGDYFPPFAGDTTDGEYFDIEDHYNIGSYIFIDFWAYWCGPCIRAMPDVVEVWDEFGGERFLVVGVNMDKPRTEEKMHSFIEEAGLTFPSVTELAGWDTSISKERGIRYIPQNYLLAPDGTILFKDLRGDALKETVKSLMSRDDIYRPIVMNIELDNDPRKEDGYRGRREAWAAGIYTMPFAPPLNTALDELRLRLSIDNPEEAHFKVVLSYKLYRPTGRRTHWIKDPATKEVWRDRNSDKPYIYYEVEIETREAILEGWDGKIETGFKLPLGDDVWEIQWELRAYSTFLGSEVHGASDSIDFAGYFTTTSDKIEEQGGIVHAEDAPPEDS